MALLSLEKEVQSILFVTIHVPSEHVYGAGKRSCILVN